MEARIVLTGNRIEGYCINISLPLEWLEMWHKRARMIVAGEELWGVWGEEEEEGTRVKKLYFNDLLDATSEMEGVEKEIRNAKEYLASVIQTERVKIIDL